MKQWDLFLISFGCVLIMMSYMMNNPLLLILSGGILIGIGVKRLRSASKKNGK